MSKSRPTDAMREILCDKHLDRDQLFQLVASLANLLDKDIVVETIHSVLGIEPVEVEDCILFDDLSIKFGDDGRVIGMYQTLDGTTEPAKSIIRNLSHDGRAS